jgi:hypothetical protein
MERPAPAAAPSTCATTGDFHAAAQIGGLGLEGRRRASRRHGLHIAANTERAAGAFEQHGANLRIIGGSARRRQQSLGHFRIERISPVRPVHGDGEQTLIEVLENQIRHAFSLSLLLVEF